jgi:hypothetical protein
VAVKKRKKRRFSIRFDMGIGGVIGLGIVSFCIFLWMFLLGVWSGQTVLLPSEPGKGAAMLTRMASDFWQQGKSSLKDGYDNGLEAVGRYGSEKDVRHAKSDAVEDRSEPSFFSLQVASFRDTKKAHRSVLGWQARGHDAFYLSPEEDSTFYRVFIGKFDKLADANALSGSLEDDENVRAYITLLPATKVEDK